MPLTVEELMKTRYLVLSGYPNTPFVIGEVLSEYSSIRFCNSAKACINKTQVRKYPEIFRLLNWYEERSDSEMPQFVKNPYRVLQVKEYDESHTLFEAEGEIIVFITNHYLPATEHEYFEFLK